MKKTLICLAVLMLAMPSLASVAITCTYDSGTQQVAVHYNNTETGNVRAFALNITIDGTGTFTAGSGWSTSYNVCPGSYVSSSSLGSPICDATKFSGTLDGIGTNGVTIEMASLYASPQPAPAKSGILGYLTVSGCGDVTVAANTIRGGAVIMEDPTLTPTVTLSGVTVDGPGCTDTCNCPGDVDADTYVSLYDLDALVAILLNAGPPDYYCEMGPAGCDNLCADLDVDGYISLYDLDALVAAILPYPPDYYYECP